MNFFIYSLPRSGSAWLSQFLSGSDSYCFHEPLIEKNNLGLMFARPYKVVGGVDTSAYQDAQTVKAQLPECKSFVLRRNWREIERSSERIGFMGIDVEAEEQKLLAVTKDMQEIEYEGFHDLNYLETIWGKIVGLTFDKVRASQLIQMNIQRNLEAVQRKMA